MEYLPNELLYKYMMELDLPAIVNQCQVSQIYKQICDDDTFWYHKVQYDYQIEEIPTNFNYLGSPSIPNDLQWKQLYYELYRGNKAIPVFLETEFVGYILIYPTTTLIELLKDTIELGQDISNDYFLINFKNKGNTIYSILWDSLLTELYNTPITQFPSYDPIWSSVTEIQMTKNLTTLRQCIRCASNTVKSTLIQPRAADEVLQISNQCLKCGLIWQD